MESTNSSLGAIRDHWEARHLTALRHVLTYWTSSRVNSWGWQGPKLHANCKQHEPPNDRVHITSIINDEKQGWCSYSESTYHCHLFPYSPPIVQWLDAHDSTCGRNEKNTFCFCQIQSIDFDLEWVLNRNTIVFMRFYTCMKPFRFSMSGEVMTIQHITYADGQRVNSNEGTEHIWIKSHYSYK